MAAIIPPTKTTVISAPGKVLIAGGYLVLDPDYSGTVVSTSSRFYSAIRDSNQQDQVFVRAPQFINAEWRYIVNFSNNSIQTDADPICTSANKFVHLALQKTLAFAAEVRTIPVIQQALSRGLSITIVGDNDFYSQRATLASMGLPSTLESLSQIPAFALTNVPISEVHKTGLGSSAALITSLTTALLIHLGIISSCEGADRKLAHNLAQYVHCLAQGKVGSGFDVSAAVFGSHIYTRFDAKVIQGLMSDVAGQMVPTLSPGDHWTQIVKPFGLPPLTRLMLADVDAGSDTPSLVGKVLRWRKADTDNANALYKDLNKANEGLSTTLLQLCDLYHNDSAPYEAVVNYLSSLQSVQWFANPNFSDKERSVLELFHQARQQTEEIRTKMREMGRLSQVPIEPPEQTLLLDACVSVSGVIGGGVPGAGGYDAIWLLVFDPRQASPGVLLPLNRVEKLWRSWEKLNVSPLSAVESTSGQGVKLERLDDIVELKALIPT